MRSNSGRRMNNTSSETKHTGVLFGSGLYIARKITHFPCNSQTNPLICVNASHYSCPAHYDTPSCKNNAARRRPVIAGLRAAKSVCVFPINLFRGSGYNATRPQRPLSGCSSLWNCHVGIRVKKRHTVIIVSLKNHLAHMAFQARACGHAAPYPMCIGDSARRDADEKNISSLRRKNAVAAVPLQTHNV